MCALWWRRCKAPLSSPYAALSGGKIPVKVKRPHISCSDKTLSSSGPEDIFCSGKTLDSKHRLRSVVLARCSQLGWDQFRSLLTVTLTEWLPR